MATIISVLACEFFEWGYRKLMHKSCAVKDLSAAVTGVLLAFVCAPTLPYWMLIIGDFFAIVVVKQLFGGLGYNFANPAIVGRIAMAMALPAACPPTVSPRAWTPPLLPLPCPPLLRASTMSPCCWATTAVCWARPAPSP